MLKDSAPKRKILEELRKGETVSGDYLASKLGVSRVAIWKHIRELKELGYGIIADKKGYKLVYEPKKPYPWEIDVQSYYLKKTTSTMEVAKKLAEKGEKSFTVIIAEEQTQGRGKLKKKWESKPGGLYFSIILRPKIKLVDVKNLAPILSSAILNTLKKLGIEGNANDKGEIFVNGKKIGGILIEAKGELDIVEYVIIGVGINVNNDVTYPLATSLKKELGREVDLLKFSKDLLSNMLNALRGNFN
ncbi:biotin--[acetyl-CoA-carboxylase] ligase [Pyrococcus furiosus DSM 3638]|uniref:Biotin operon repressor/biotin--[acetyl CoA carboxylase] ligase n=3 Tax=Pyrococcus furiosus TaxID=2261 RepID=Q8U0C3_PYRFU|nr:biotin--[acetyl-CoA-carboxylase] ligase [Pyrococcus furiosus]AAL81800.1 biotin operon repressor/biotin--[acetyl CoA carboxylase] ligase [Pyrococcus furiosus DSM 3638]AFN04964.1 biotin operon repressor/biotin--[acetyl CoA carboxylase] ligase [Pyrococcus furiosus COM1]QEK79719.1 biotin--[acetyl-CoA-carboxylase] ligase [Pyrococcus furiosus DSM 3638]